MLALRHSRPVPLQTEDATARRTSQILRIAEEAACSLEERLKPGSVSREKIDQRRGAGVVVLRGTVAEGAPNATDLAGEISHALVVTLVGVGVSVPAIFFYTFFKNRLTAITHNTSNLADDLLTQMYHNSKKAAGATATAGTDKVASTGVQTKP